MLFNSWQFAIFLPIVFSLYWITPSKYRWIVILSSSYFFYGCWNVKYLSLIILVTLVSYLGGIGIEKAVDEKHKKLIIWAVCIVSFGLLFVFKYFNFAIESINSLLRLCGREGTNIVSNLLLPVGISFYTFQSIGYVIDVYREEIRAERHFGIFASFVAFFPQLVAGPIERTSNLLPQIKAHHTFNYDKATYGLKLMAWGLFKKVVIADTLGAYVDTTYENLHTFAGFAKVLAIFFFSVQIYCDFSGYSDIARGVAKLFDIDLMENFKSPYFSASIKEFWRRWHISLSTWFRDYVYIPLGGSRCSTLKTIRNVMITFLTSGLWHGAAWTFVVWGGGHGALQAVETGISKNKVLSKISIPRWIKIVVTFILVSLLWTVFRAESVKDAAYICLLNYRDFDSITSWLSRGISNLGMGIKEVVRVVCMLMMLAMYDFASLKNDVISHISRINKVVRWAVYFGIVILIFFWAPSESAEFIYFDF